MVYVAEKVGETNEGDFYKIDAPLHEAVKAFRVVGIQTPFLVTPFQMTDFRLTVPDKTNQTYTRTSCSPVKVRGEPTIVTANSPWLIDEATAGVAVEAQRRSEYPTMSTDFYDALKAMAEEQSTKEPEDRTVHVMEGKPNADGVITLKPKSADARALGVSENYFSQFNHPSILFYDLRDEDISKGVATANYLWFDRPGGGSFFGAGYRVLYCDGRSFGVLPKTAFGGSQKSGYTPTEVREAVIEGARRTLKSTELTGLEKTIVEPTAKETLEVLRIKQ